MNLYSMECCDLLAQVLLRQTHSRTEVAQIWYGAPISNRWQNLYVAELIDIPDFKIEAVVRT